jgi:3-phenylpropionate/cinnamic acid dioxygenase small subunit
VATVRVTVEIQIEIERFLFHEARLLEDHRLDEWLALLSNDIKYFMPTREAIEPSVGAADAVPSSSLALFDDDKDSLALRAGRMKSRLSPTEMPPALVQRLITNVHAAATDRPGEYRVRSNFLVYEERRGRHASTFIGSRDDVLRRVDQSFQIARREIRLAQTILPGTITLFF